VLWRKVIVLTIDGNASGAVEVAEAVLCNCMSHGLNQYFKSIFIIFFWGEAGEECDSEE
jgi:hypothetical protein